MPATPRDSVIIVPVDVDALVLTDPVRRQGFRRWQPNFHLLTVHMSPEPEPYSNEDPADWPGIDPVTHRSRNGVYVQWRLPRALCKGKHDGKMGQTEFPLVPSRWFVYRRWTDSSGTDKYRAWVVESDYLGKDGTSPFTHPYDPKKTTIDPAETPYRTALSITRVGKSIELVSGRQWTEPGITDKWRKEPFLTAFGPGMLAFHRFQPYHQDVFSLFDPVADLPTTGATVLSYYVIGWYAQRDADPVKKAGTVKAVREALGWVVAETHLDDDTPLTDSYYQGHTHDVTWDPQSTSAPNSNRPQREKIRVAIGNSAMDAFTTLVNKVAGENSLGTYDPRMLDALQHGTMHQLDGADGAAKTDQALHTSWFQPSHGGLRWLLADVSKKGPSASWTGLSEKEEKWLAGLNTTQRAYDAATRELDALRQQLYWIWWLCNVAELPPWLDRANLLAQINPNAPNQLAATINAKKTARDNLAANLPGDHSPAGLAQFLKDKGINESNQPPRYELRREALPPFYQPADPTILLAGANNQQPPDPLKPGLLTCRLGSMLLVGLIKPSGNGFLSVEQQVYTELRSRAGLNPYVELAVRESILLDPANYKLVGASSADELKSAIANCLAPLPPRITETWTQPWRPLYLQWEAVHHPIPRLAGSRENWEFDGHRYRWTGGAQAALRILRGRQMLVPLPQFNLADRAGKQAKSSEVETFQQALAKLDLLSQRLEGFTDQLAGRDPGTQVSPPAGTIGGLVADAYRFLPDPGPMPTPFEQAPSEFPQIRAGQFSLNRLTIVDEFGHTVEVVLAGGTQDFKPVISPNLTPTAYAAPQFRQRLVELPPRLLQGARMRFDFVDPAEDRKLIDLNAGTNPIAAWILPNYLDRALLCFDPYGTALGELRLRMKSDKEAEVAWVNLPTAANKPTPSKLLASFKDTLVSKGPHVYLDLLRTIDTVLAGIDPGNPYGDQVLGTLVGRPLALVHTRLALELDGPPIRDPNWKYLSDWTSLVDWKSSTSPEAAAHVAYEWAVRLGNPGQVADGLVGYFPRRDFTRFITVDSPTRKPHEVPKPDQEYVLDGNSDTRLWPRLKGSGEDTTHLTLLMDPQAAVHATSDLLPVATLALPPRFVQNALARMEVSLRMGGVLAPTRTPPHPPGNPAQPVVVLPRPAVGHGTWDWAERSATEPSTWTAQAIVPSDPDAHLDPAMPTVRSGFLRLRGAFGASREGGEK